MEPRRTVRTKLVLLSILVVAVVAGATAVLDYRLSRQWIEEDLEERAIIFAQEIAATIRSRDDLRNRTILEALLARLIEIRPNVLQLDVLLFDGAETRLAASSGGPTRLPFTRQDTDRVRQAKVTSRLVEGAAGRYWEILAPITLDGGVTGAVAVKFSSRRVDQLMSRLTTGNVAVTAVSVLLIGVLVSLVARIVVDRPIGRFMTAIARIRNGDASATVDVHTRDEFGEMAEHFNEMLARITQFNRELQDRVAAATIELDRRYHELQRLNAVLFEQQRSLARAERLALAGRLMAEVAHEVGTPLHSVAGHLELLRNDLPPELRSQAIGRRLHVVETQVTRLIEVISTLLDLTRRPATDPRPVDLTALACELAELVRPGLARASTALELEVAAGLPAIQGHPDQLQQVVLNLLTNAIDATGPGGRIVVATRARADSGEVEIAVSDTGPGIAPSDRERIFEPFYSTKEATGGTGLGLFITAQIVREHKGRIEVETPAGGGSTFRVLLPVTATSP